MKCKIFILGGIVSLLVSILFVGQYYDPEDGDRTFFIKYKPTLHQLFYSPVALHRYLPSKLTPNEEVEEIAFQEFVAKRHLLKRGNVSSFFPALLIQATLTFLVYGLYSFRTKIPIKNRKVILQFLINIIFTTFALTYISLADNHLTTLFSTLVIVTLNLLSLVLLTRLSSARKNTLSKSHNSW